MHRQGLSIALILLTFWAAAAGAAGAAGSSDMAGWTKRGDAAGTPATCTVELPRLPLRQAVATMTQRPAELARPVVRCERAVSVPLAADPMLLERVEGQEPTLSWTPRLEALDRGGGVLAVDVDVLPWRPAPVVLDPSVPQPVAPAPAVRRYEPPRVRTDPTRHGASEPEPALFSTESVPPTIAARRLEGIDSDVLALSSGDSWLAVELAVERGRLLWYRLSSSEIFGLPGRIIVAPTPRHPRALLELLVVDPPTGAVTSLGRPSPRGAAWRQELSDIRERDGATEALVIVRDASPRGDIDGPISAALMRREAGAWSQVAAMPLPAGAAPRCVRFDAADPRVIVLTARETTWIRRLP